MKVSVATFGGNKNNYHNFKQNFVDARQKLRASDVYIPYASPVRDILWEVFEKLREIEFEDE